ncbi:MAG TPA: FAD-binding oxidoreductase [Candidatus Binatia bacterium]|jgi:FAD/FMN-containing dehydrogenase|nr:FAD-binding oxidoreductase [Candidatus Binatia bacterium]
MGDLRVTTMIGAETLLKGVAVDAFKASLRGELLCPGDAGYDGARQIWNGMIDKRPALIVCCRGVVDIINSVNFARANNLLISVRGGGHNLAGNAVCDGGLMVNLSGMKSIRVDPVYRTARAEPGLTWGEFDRETQAFGLATTGGQVSTTGIAGLTLGGGWGYLARQYGLTCDNLLSVDIVTADGKFLTTNATEHADLFWGVRGGGGNFGVVTSFEYQLHRVGPVLGGIVAYPFEKAKEVLKFFREFTSTAPDELASAVILITMPDGTPVAGIAVCYNGPIEAGERILGPLRAFGTPLADQIGPIPYTAAQKLIDALYPSGLQNYWKSSFLKAISDEAIDTMVAYCAKRPSPMCHGLIEHQLGGAVSRVDREATAFIHRDVQYSFMSLGVCADSADAEKCVRWAREFWEAMQPCSTGGVYVNYLGREADEGAERIKAAYGPEKYQRLVALKNKYDPTNLFQLNQNIKPTV